MRRLALSSYITYKQGQEQYASECVDSKYPTGVVSRKDFGSTSLISLVYDKDTNTFTKSTSDSNRPISFWLLFTCAIVPGSVSVVPCVNDIVEQDTIGLNIINEEMYWKQYLNERAMSQKRRMYCAITWQHKWTGVPDFQERYVIKYKVYDGPNGSIDPIERELEWELKLRTYQMEDKR